jgi:hypothetical protein
MTKPTIRIHNAETGEVIDREMNDIEFAQYQADQKAMAIEKAEVKVKQDEKAALLERLGLTAEEAVLLLS